MAVSIASSLFFIICIVSVSSSPYCSAWCDRAWDGFQFTNQCGDDTKLSCLACDTSIFKFDVDNTQCLVDTTIYKLETTLLNDPTQIAAWTSSTGLGMSSQTDGFYTYDLCTFHGTCNTSFTTTLSQNHSSVRLRMFLYIPSANNIGNFTVVLNGVNTTHTFDTSFSKFLSPVDDYYLYTTPDIPHNGTNLIISFFLEAATLGSYNLGLKQLLVFTKKCPSNCLDCHNNGSNVVCTACNLNYAHYKGRCYAQCLAGTYMSDTECLPCLPSCATCLGGTRCTSCSQIFSSPKFLLQNGTCAATCPEMTFANKENFVCSKCAMGCLTCDGDQIEDCLSCGIDEKGYFYYLSANGEGCQIDCPSGQLRSPNLSENKCIYCHPSCKTCSANMNNCTSCNQYNQDHVPLILFDHSCSINCPTNYLIIERNCHCPNVSFYEASLGNCRECDRSCRTCFNSSTSGCISCNPGYYLVVNTSICQQMCPTGQFINQTTSQCVLCSKECISCNGSPFNCTGCSNTTYLYENKCRKVCPDGYQGFKYPHVCRRCSLGTYSYNNTCINLCPPLYKVDEDTNACVQFIEEPDPSLLDFVIIPSFINKGAQLCLHLLFKTKLMLIHNANTKVQVFVTSSSSRRLLGLSSQTLNISNVDVDESLLSLKIYTDVPTSLKISPEKSNDQIIVNFKDGGLKSENGTQLTRYKSLAANNPGFIREIYNSFYDSELDTIGMVFSIIGILLIPFGYFKKFAYYPIIEFLLQLQLMRLIGFTLYPVNYQNFVFLKGFDAAQFQWMPNVVNIATLNTFAENSFAAYQFKSSTMNFLSLSASNLLFFLVFQPVLGYLYLYDKQYFSKLILWAEKTLLYVCSTNILFAAISSFVSLFINTQNLTVFFIVSQLLGLVAIGTIVYFFILQRKQFRKYKMFFLNSLAFCVLAPFFSKSYPVSFVLLNTAQVGILVASYKNRKRSDKRTKPLLIGRVLFLVMFNVVELGSFPPLVIAVASLFFAVELGIIGYIMYLSFKKKRSHERKESVKNIDIKDQVVESRLEGEDEFVREQIVKFSDGRPEDVMYEQERSQRSPRKKPEGRKDSMTYYSPRKNWRAYNNNKSRTIYKEEQVVNNDQSDRSKVSGTHLSINPFGVQENSGRA